MLGSSADARLAIPKHWPRSIQAALVHAMALAHYILVTTRSWAADSPNQRVQLAAKADQLQQEVALLREELRIKDDRLAGIAAHQRPHYKPEQRLDILELRAARGWSLAQTARAFQSIDANYCFVDETPRRTRASRAVAHA